jgi:tetratricopeptide (TPR) repeat protein
MRKMIMILCAAAMAFTSVYADESAKQVPLKEQLSIANNFLKNKQFDEAIDVLNDIVEENPLNTRALKLRGNAYFVTENYESSLRDFDALLQQNPRRARAHFDRGIVYFAMGFDELAMDDIENAFALNPDLIQQVESKPNFGQKIHEMREKTHTAKFQVRHKGGMINTKTGGLITKTK